ncbi:hydroxyacylglutathione hydrolase [Lacimicrobium alkaliphilum]|uniref:Hydroxyacylglutathione hydrolase n=1 Tax=Lacimicrobium alkaliphilum TaxID=1526571 RepID=A0ABQ1RIQ4_9ALTE|nr:hydroxyacylglutathione hydrolase [Lacimicrobium alkaliphilum]GGD68335.1 hydroxyacylglutathione hydrolase [Lacimicrobium alkaliphilum]
MEVLPVSAFKDNYIWCLIEENRCVVVDPGDADPVLKLLNERGLTLTDILITHHHWDHTDGLDKLMENYPEINIFGPVSDKIAQVTVPLGEGDHCKPAGLSETFTVLEIPGHTLDHIAFYSENIGLFCGDTLFSVGCGRIFEGTPEQMYKSLQKLARLPEDTAVYCGHEYTLANLDFACAVEPDNKDRQQYQQWAKQQRQQKHPTLPGSIGQELRINPFLRPQAKTIVSSVQQHSGKTLSSAEQVFTEIRRWKDNF